MKHIKKHLKKISTSTIKKAITTLVVLFFIMVMILQKDAPTTELQFIWNSNESLIHNAPNDNPPPNQRDYLFQNEAGNPEYQWQITKWQDLSVTPPGPVKTMDELVNGNVASGSLLQTGQIYSWTLYSWTLTTWVSDTWTLLVETSNTGSLDCITPWKEKVKNKDFVLGYQQRKDVNTMCNIEKRICNDGILGGTFDQPSCKEDMVFLYRKAGILSYNQKVLNEFIQPSDPVNKGAEFSNEGKINTSQTPTTTRGTTNSPIRVTASGWQTSGPEKMGCITPRGQIIKHGQFVKAYKASRGFIDLACNVEIRACVNGSLKGHFIHPKCTFNNTTYADYLQAGSPPSNTLFLFFQRIKGVFSF